jgi:hypothetical protein
VNLYVNPEEIMDENFVATKIVSITKDNFEDVKFLIRKRVKKYLPLLSKISISTSEMIKQKLDEEKQAYMR